MIKLHCPGCGSSEKIAVQTKPVNSYILNCPRCGKWEINLLQLVTAPEQHEDGCQCGYHRNQ